MLNADRQATIAGVAPVLTNGGSYVRVTRYPSLSGLESWAFHNWRGPTMFRANGCWLLADATVVVVAPGDVLVFEQKSLEQPRSAFSFTALHVSSDALATENIAPGTKVFRSGAIEDVSLTSTLHRFVESLGDAHAQPKQLADDFRVLLAEILEFGAAQAGRVRRVYSRAVACTREYLHAHWLRGPSLNDLATHVGVSKWHLTRSFTTSVGMSPSTYARALRASHALDALRYGASASHTSGRMGFSDQSHLTRELRRFYGVTPSLFRLARAEAPRRLAQRNGLAQVTDKPNTRAPGPSRSLRQVT